MTLRAMNAVKLLTRIRIEAPGLFEQIREFAVCNVSGRVDTDNHKPRRAHNPQIVGSTPMPAPNFCTDRNNYAEGCDSVNNAERD